MFVVAFEKTSAAIRIKPKIRGGAYRPDFLQSSKPLGAAGRKAELNRAAKATGMSKKNLTNSAKQVHSERMTNQPVSGYTPARKIKPEIPGPRPPNLVDSNQPKSLWSKVKEKVFGAKPQMPAKAHEAVPPKKVELTQRTPEQQKNIIQTNKSIKSKYQKKQVKLKKQEAAAAKKSGDGKPKEMSWGNLHPDTKNKIMYGAGGLAAGAIATKALSSDNSHPQYQQGY